MPVDTRHRRYDDASAQWQRLRDVLAGEDAVKASASAYLPPLEGMRDGTGDYDAYVQRASFHAATARTVDGLCGAIFRKPPAIEIPAQFEALKDNVTGKGAPLDTIAKSVVREVLSVARLGLLVDMPTDGGDAFLACYDAESIVNWRVETQKGKPVLTMVVLRECVYQPKPDDPFAEDEVEQYRVLRLGTLENSQRLRYFIDIWRKVQRGAGAEEWEIVESLMPTKRGESLDFIPFICVGVSNLTLDVEKSPVLDLANTNLSHFRTSADLEHGAHFTALPTIWVSGGFAGATETGSDDLMVGSLTAWNLEAGAQVGMLEYQGQGLSALENRLERKEKHMAVLGARLLEDQKTGVEAADTVRMRHRGENSMLASIADTAGRGLTQAINWMIWWQGGPDAAATITLNKDFFDADMGPQDVVALVDAWQKGGIGGRALHYNLMQGERLPPDMDYETWQADIEENGAAALGLLPMAVGPAPGDETDETDGTGKPKEAEKPPAEAA